MVKFTITTDSTSDLPKEYIVENEISIISLNIKIQNGEYLEEKDYDIREFYKKLREGETPSTSQINPAKAKEEFEKYLKNGLDVLHISFSSGLSGSYNSCKIAAEELKEIYTENSVIVVDSLCASLGEGLLVHKCVQLKKQGKTIDQIVNYIENNKLNICHYVAVDDLKHLYRGGRISKSSAIIGGMVGVKPIIHVDNNGKLVPISKTRGRKQSLNSLVQYMKDLIGSYVDKNDIIFISHADCEKDARYVADKIQQTLGIEAFLINLIGPTVGAHTGPGTVGLFFMGEER